MDDDGRQVITIAHPEPCSGELKGDLMVYLFVVLRMRMRSHQFTLGYRRAFCLNVPHGLYNMFANSKGSSKTELMRRLGLAFGGRLCDKYPFIVCWLIYTSRVGWSGGAKVLCILHHRGVQLILAYSWARPAILVVGKGRGGMFLFLLFLHFHSCSSFFPVPLFYLFYCLFYLFSPFLWETTQNDPQGLTCR